jgi:hypothetical protein
VAPFAFDLEKAIAILIFTFHLIRAGRGAGCAECSEDVGIRGAFCGRIRTVSLKFAV